MKKQFVLTILTLFQLGLEAIETPPKENTMMRTATATDVCNVIPIYNKEAGYEYSLPKSILESFLSGKAFDNPEVYTKEEAQNLRDDINTLYQQIISASPHKEKIAFITAGAPGAGKTFLMRQVIEQCSLLGQTTAYIDPDDVCLKNQTKTYQADIKNGDGSKEARLAAYNKWRPGSNAANHLILANLIKDNYAFYFGTTSTSPQTGKFFEFLKKQGYEIRLIHVSAPDDVRWGSIQARDETFVQTTEKDVAEKGDMLPLRIYDTYLNFADNIEFNYRGGVHEDAKPAATWTRNDPGSGKLGTLTVTDEVGYEKIKTIHNAVVTRLNKPELLWETAVEKNSDR